MLMRQCVHEEILLDISWGRERDMHFSHFVWNVSGAYILLSIQFGCRVRVTTTIQCIEMLAFQCMSNDKIVMRNIGYFDEKKTKTARSHEAKYPKWRRINNKCILVMIHYKIINTGHNSLVIFRAAQNCNIVKTIIL